MVVANRLAVCTVLRLHVRLLGTWPCHALLREEGSELGTGLGWLTRGWDPEGG